QLGGGQYSQYALGGGMPAAQPTWSPPAPAEEVPYQQESPRRGRSRAGARGAAQPGSGQPSAARPQRSWDEEDSEVTDDPMEAFSRRWARRGADTPQDARHHKRLWVIGGGAAGAGDVAAAVVPHFPAFSRRGHPT